MSGAVCGRRVVAHLRVSGGRVCWGGAVPEVFKVGLLGRWVVAAVSVRCVGVVISSSGAP